MTLLVPNGILNIGSLNDTAHTLRLVRVDWKEGGSTWTAFNAVSDGGRQDCFDYVASMRRDGNFVAVYRAECSIKPIGMVDMTDEEDE